MLLSDGMGTGKKAYEDSRRLIETLEDLLEAGLSEEFALERLAFSGQESIFYH